MSQYGNQFDANAQEAVVSGASTAAAIIPTDLTDSTPVVFFVSCAAVSRKIHFIAVACTTAITTADGVLLCRIRDYPGGSKVRTVGSWTLPIMAVGDVHLLRVPDGNNNNGVNAAEVIEFIMTTEATAGEAVITPVTTAHWQGGFDTTVRTKQYGTSAQKSGSLKGVIEPAS